MEDQIQRLTYQFPNAFFAASSPLPATQAPIQPEDWGKDSANCPVCGNKLRRLHNCTGCSVCDFSSCSI